MTSPDKSSSIKNKQQSPAFQIQIPFLSHMKKVMIPHQKQFNIIDFFQLIIDYCIKLPNQSFQSTIIQDLNTNQPFLKQSSSGSISELKSPTLSPKRSISPNKSKQLAIAAQIKQKKIKYAQELLDKLKNIFLWYRKKTISYQMINNYVLSCQNRTLKYKNCLQNLRQYQNLPQRRVRLDQNVKLCIMPQGDSGKIKFLSVNPKQQNRQDIYRKQIFVVTSQYIRGIYVDSQKLAKQGNKSVKIHDLQNLNLNKISIIKNWYTYSQSKVIPQSTNNNEKDMKINAKKQLYIEKVAVSQHLMGMITHDKQVLIKPYLNDEQKYQRGRKVVPYQIRLGNLVTDIPDQNLQRPIKKDKSKFEQIIQSKVLLFECYNDDIWIIVNESFVYVYILPLPDSNQYINDQEQKNKLLSLCQPLPSKAIQAKLLTKQYLAIMLQTPCIIILKLQLSSNKQFKQKNRIYPTNKIYNDIKFICMNYHPVQKQLLFTDFGSYLIRLKFNITDGDIERQGPVYDQQTGRFLTQNTTNTKRDKQFSMLKKQSQINIQQSLKNHLSKQELEKINKQTKKSNKKQTLTVWQNKGTSVAQISSISEINLSCHKQAKKEKKQENDRSGMSIYAKPQNTDYMTIVKNNSRQNMILLCLNKNTSTLITYEQQSVNPLNISGKQDEQNDKDRLYDKTIKLWDINYMNVYQTFKLSLQIIDLSLQSNGLYIVTKERGYLGFYPLLNKQQNSQILSIQNTKQLKKLDKQNKKQLSQNTNKPRSTLGDKIIISGNQIFFYTQLQKQRNYNKIQQQGYQNHLINYNNAVTTIYNLSLTNDNHIISNLQQIPADINQFQVNQKLYVLSDTTGDKKYNLHIYDILGNKQSILKANKRTQKYGILQNYTNLRKINHFQFNILLWNKHSIKFIGSNLQQSLTIHWTFNCKNRLNNKHNQSQSSKIFQSQIDVRSLKSSLLRKQKSIQDIYINQNSISIQQKLQTDMFKNVTLSIYHMESGRIKYRINDIKSDFKLLEMFNNMLLVHEKLYKKSSTSNEAQQLQTTRRQFHKSFKPQNNSIKMQNTQSMGNISQNMSSFPTSQNEQHINLVDLNSPYNKKCSLTLRFKSLIQSNMTVNQIQKYQMDFNNAISHDKFYNHKFIQLKSAKLFTINNDDHIIISCIFHIKHQFLFKKTNSSTSINKTKVFKQTNKYLLYTRQISSQISNKMNYIPRTSDANIKKVNKKVMFQYMGQAQIHQRIVGHWQIDLQQLLARSNIRNFNYLHQIHSDSDFGINFINQDITNKLLSFYQQKNTASTFLNYNQNIIKLYQSGYSKQSNQNINFQWILSEAQSPKSIISLYSPNFFQLYSQTISISRKNIQNMSNTSQDKKQLPKMNIKVQKLCNIEIDKESDQPIINNWNESFNSDNKVIWQQTKCQMVQYIKHKLSKQTQKLLNSPTNTNKINQSYMNRKVKTQKSSLITLQQSLQQTKKQEQIKKSNKSIKQSSQKEQPELQQQKSQINKQQSQNQQSHQKQQHGQKNPLKNHFNSNQINNMFRQWHINKKIEKEMKQYENNTNQAQKQLNKQIKMIIQDPTLKQQRIKYLLSFPQKIKDPRLFNALQIISNKLKQNNKNNDIFALINQNKHQDNIKLNNTKNISQSVNQQTKQQEKKQIKKQIKKQSSKQVSQSHNKKKKENQTLQNRIQVSLQKLQNLLALPKINNQQKTIKSKSSFGTSKLSQLKDTKKEFKDSKQFKQSKQFKSINQTKQLKETLHLKQSRGHSSLINSQLNQFSSPLRNDKNLNSLKSTNKLPLTRTKTQNSDRNYLQLITQTPFQSPIKSSKKGTTIQKYKFNSLSPNPQSSLSNIKVSYSPNLVLTQPGERSIINQHQLTGNNKLQAKKSKSVLTRAKTQMSNTDDQILTNISRSALIQLKQSKKTINKSVLPQIKINRQKLNEKMKQKKSFLKLVNQRLSFTKQQLKQQILKRQNKNYSQRQRLLTIQ